MNTRRLSRAHIRRGLIRHIGTTESAHIFELKAQLNVHIHSLDGSFDLSTRLGSFIAGSAVPLLWENKLHDFLKRFWSISFLWIPALPGLAMYVLIVVLNTYLGGFLLLV